MSKADSDCCHASEVERLRKRLAREQTEFAKFIGRAVKLRDELNAMIESITGMDAGDDDAL